MNSFLFYLGKNGPHTNPEGVDIQPQSGFATFSGTIHIQPLWGFARGKIEMRPWPV
jgi:hypothetical protein